MNMKKKFNILFMLFFFIFKGDILYAQDNTNSLTNREACQLYYSNIATSKDIRSKGSFYTYSYLDLGFRVKADWIPSNFDSNRKRDSVRDYTKTIIRSKDGYFIVGSIYNNIVASKINVGDVIISLDGKEFKNKPHDDYIDLILTKEEGEKISLVLRNEKGNEYEVTVQREFNTYDEVDYELDYLSVNNIDIKNNRYSISITHDFFYFREFVTDLRRDEEHILYKLALGSIIFQEFENEWHGYICNPDNDDFLFSQLLDPSTYSIKNVIKSDKSLERVKNEIVPYSKLKGIDNTRNAVAISKTISKVVEIKNDFNLKSFPFDKQTLVLEIFDHDWSADARLIDLNSKTFKVLDAFINKDDIPGWQKNKYALDYITENQIGMMDGEYAHGFKLTIELERKYGYYIFKVIFPIMLILLICWASVWINPKELESRLTITIVCLLSLIAYNFVIDSELPKLEYLTVLDWIILISYVYATIPNILSVYSFKICSTNKVLSDKVESVARKFGIASYVGLVILIIAINANLNPENSGSLISWMTF